jgi:hypothetical protein
VKACFTADCDAQYSIHLLCWMWQGFESASSTISYLIHNSLSPLCTEVLKQRCIWRIIPFLIQQVKYYILWRMKWIYSFIKYSLCASQRTLCASIRKSIWWMFYRETMPVFSLRIAWETQKRCVDGICNLLILNLAVHRLSLLLGFEGLDYVLIFINCVNPCYSHVVNYLPSEMCFLPH